MAALPCPVVVAGVIVDHDFPLVFVDVIGFLQRLRLLVSHSAAVLRCQSHLATLAKVTLGSIVLSYQDLIGR